jgi:hypothetical protein
MDSLDKYFSDDRILHYVCRCRAKLAKRRYRQQLVYNVTGNPGVLPGNLATDEERVLHSILPPRRMWKKLDEKARRKRSTGKPLNTLDKTVRILKRTVRWCQAKQPDATFLAELVRFYDEVRAYVTVAHPVLPRPDIVPIVKERGKTACRPIRDNAGGCVGDVKDGEKAACRPIASYPLAAKIAICITNRYLSERFDAFFEPCSFAFRMPEVDGGCKPPTTHHDAFARIAEIRRRRKKCDFWVAECDIQKFYDTVNHSVLKKAFGKLVAKANRAHPERPVSEAAVRLFLAYLESYSFTKDVLPLNNPKTGYFARHHKDDCEFLWVADELKKRGVYRSLSNAKIGVPQGGALSGLIANILLDQIDKKLLKHGDRNLTYVRYCDDMIMMHPRKGKCVEYMEVYVTELKKLKLLPHAPKQVAEYGHNFWQTKSKQPYKWGPRGFVPWVGFVGYEINVHGDVRVRKSSLAKEMQKQYETVQEVLRAIKGRPRASHKTIEESVAGRLVQMSVGRVRLHDFQTAESELCWVNGFRCLTDNKYSRIQMRRLDACRNSLLRRLRKHLSGVEESDSTAKSKSRQIVYHGKPFSYYYHAIEKRRDAPSGPAEAEPIKPG